MVVELVVLLFDGLDAVEDGEERVLQCLGVSAQARSAFDGRCYDGRAAGTGSLPQLVSCLAAKRLDVLA